MPLHPVCARTSTVDFSVPLVTSMFELLTIPPCTLKGRDELSAFTSRPFSAGLVLSVRMALPGLLAAVIGTVSPDAPVEGSGSHTTRAELGASPVLPGRKSGSTSSPLVPKHSGNVALPVSWLYSLSRSALRAACAAPSAVAAPAACARRATVARTFVSA